jgi:hypothetical protein
MSRPLTLPCLALALFHAPGAFAAAPCGGHQLLPKPRPPTSCFDIKPQIFVSPDKRTIASVLAVDISLNATPDMESRVVMRSSAGATLSSKDYSSPNGTNGYYVLNAEWSPDSQFFAYSMMSSGGHSPWSFPIAVYSVEKNQFARFSDMIAGSPTLSGAFTFSAPHTLNASTWQAPGDLDHRVPVSVDLAIAFDKSAAPPN